MRVMTSVAVAAVCTGLVLGCGERVEEEAAGISLADVAGEWDVRAVAETGDTVTWRLHATEGRTGWTMTFPDREPIQTRVVEVTGDSLVMQTDSYESVLRAGVRVSVRSVARVQGGRMMGDFVATYESGEPATVRGTFEGTRAGM